MEGSVIVAGEREVMDVVSSDYDSQKKYRIQVSNTKKPLFFYLNLAKRYIKQNNDVELSALGMAIPTVVTIAEILKSSGWARQKTIVTSTVGAKDEYKGRLVLKAKIEIVLGKAEIFEKSAYTAKASKVAPKNIKIHPAATKASENVIVGENEKPLADADNVSDYGTDKNVQKPIAVSDQVSEENADGSNAKPIAITGKALQQNSNVETGKQTKNAHDASEKCADGNTKNSDNAPEKCAVGDTKSPAAAASKNADDKNDEKPIASAPKTSQNAAA